MDYIITRLDFKAAANVNAKVLSPGYLGKTKSIFWLLTENSKSPKSRHLYLRSYPVDSSVTLTLVVLAISGTNLCVLHVVSFYHNEISQARTILLHRRQESSYLTQSINNMVAQDPSNSTVKPLGYYSLNHGTDDMGPISTLPLREESNGDRWILWQRVGENNFDVSLLDSASCWVELPAIKRRHDLKIFCHPLMVWQFCCKTLHPRVGLYTRMCIHNGWKENNII